MHACRRSMPMINTRLSLSLEVVKPSLVSLFLTLAGADIKEMKDKAFPWTYERSMLGHWSAISGIR